MNYNTLLTLFCDWRCVGTTVQSLSKLYDRYSTISYSSTRWNETFTTQRVYLFPGDLSQQGTVVLPQLWKKNNHYIKMLQVAWSCRHCCLFKASYFTDKWLYFYREINSSLVLPCDLTSLLFPPRVRFTDLITDLINITLHSMNDINEFVPAMLFTGNLSIV